ncbi:unnamed protein product [Prunus armeniaca]|uniref:Uncharacterized protein n=1 Tax=Prunus armeniaca TaxID=36596 RepID=A0A6J5XHV3_PRUAR|nr:unnamed protein product [Prunus armeniaca]
MEEYEVDTEVDEINLCSGRSISFADKVQQNEETDSSKVKKKANEKEIKVSSSKKTVVGEIPLSS